MLLFACDLGFGEVLTDFLCFLDLVLQFEKHEEKVDPEHAHRHHVEAQVSEAAALGLGGYAIHERHEEHVFRKQEESYEKSHGGGRHHGRHHRE